MTYVLSDIHGHERRFRSILGQICLRPEDTLYILGDVIDRNSGGIRILRQIMAMPNAKMLLGNHEYMMLRALGRPYDDNTDDGRAMEHWYRNGGSVTHQQFKFQPKTVRREILDYLLSLPLCYDLEIKGTRYKLVHGAPAESFDHDPKYRGEIHFAVWKRWDAGDVFPTGYTMIFGHTPTKHYQDCVPMALWRQGTHIGIDCGSAYPEGRLCCLRLEDGEVFYSNEAQT